LIERKIITNPKTEKALDEMEKKSENKSQIHLRIKLDGTKCKSTQGGRMYQQLEKSRGRTTHSG
jgi:hypothetical protein